MSARLENIPYEPPEDMEQVLELSDGEKERLSQLAVMLKAQKLFSMPRVDDDIYRSPDYVQEYELITETMSFLRDKEARRRLVYRRLVNDQGELILDSQVLEFRDDYSAVPGVVVITCDRFPEGEVPPDMIQCIDEFLNDHLDRYESR